MCGMRWIELNAYRGSLDSDMNALLRRWRVNWPARLVLVPNLMVEAVPQLATVAKPRAPQSLEHKRISLHRYRVRYRNKSQWMLSELWKAAVGCSWGLRLCLESIWEYLVPLWDDVWCRQQGLWTVSVLLGGSGECADGVSECLEDV